MKTAANYRKNNRIIPALNSWKQGFEVFLVSMPYIGDFGVSFGDTISLIGDTGISFGGNHYPIDENDNFQHTNSTKPEVYI
jgi:hypothetical protein